MLKLAHYISVPARMRTIPDHADALFCQFRIYLNKASGSLTFKGLAVHCSVLNLLCLNVLCLWALCLSLNAQAQIQSVEAITSAPSPQSVPPTNPPSATGGNLNVTGQAKLEGRPAWSELDPNQKIALSPLQKLWPKISDYQRQKWLVISKNYMNLSSEEQVRIQGRMKEWVSLSTEERAVARLNYAEVNKLSEDQKRVKWEAYQALEPDAKQKLLNQTQPLPKGAAIALKPTDKNLLTLTPGTLDKRTDARVPRIDTSQISVNTLLKIPSKSVQGSKVTNLNNK